MLDCPAIEVSSLPSTMEDNKFDGPAISSPSSKVVLSFEAVCLDLVLSLLSSNSVFFHNRKSDLSEGSPSQSTVDCSNNSNLTSPLIQEFESLINIIKRECKSSFCIAFCTGMSFLCPATLGTVGSQG